MIGDILISLNLRNLLPEHFVSYLVKSPPTYCLILLALPSASDSILIQLQSRGYLRQTTHEGMLLAQQQWHRTNAMGDEPESG